MSVPLTGVAAPYTIHVTADVAHSVARNARLLSGTDECDVAGDNGL